MKDKFVLGLGGYIHRELSVSFGSELTYIQRGVCVSVGSGHMYMKGYLCFIIRIKGSLC